VEAVSSFSSERTFRIWNYTVSHSQLLLRSVKREHHDTRVDMLFKAVDRVDLPSTLAGLHVELIADRVYSARGTNWQGSVRAGAMFVIEDQGSYADPSTLFVGGLWAAASPD
jgi:hypothetical protein